MGEYPAVVYKTHVLAPNVKKQRERVCRAVRGGASFRSADAAQVCSNVGLVAADGECEGSVAMTAMQIVSERW